MGVVGSDFLVGSTSETEKLRSVGAEAGPGGGQSGGIAVGDEESACALIPDQLQEGPNCGLNDGDSVGPGLEDRDPFRLLEVGGDGKDIDRSVERDLLFDRVWAADELNG